MKLINKSFQQLKLINYIAVDVGKVIFESYLTTGIQI